MEMQYSETPPPEGVDLAAVLGEAYALDAGGRGDEHLPHVSDISGLCYREAWARRKGLPMTPVGTQARTGWDVGHAAERTLLERIQPILEAKGWRCARGGTVALWDGGGSFAVESPSEQAYVGRIVGHMDFWARKGSTIIVIDTKSTVWNSSFGPGGKAWKPYDDVKQSHLLQVASYGVAMNATYAAIWELDLGGKSTRQAWIRVADWEKEVMRRVREVLALTDPSRPAPPAEPHEWTLLDRGDSWACGYTKQAKGETVIRPGYCRYHECPNHSAQLERHG